MSFLYVLVLSLYWIKKQKIEHYDQSMNQSRQHTWSSLKIYGTTSKQNGSGWVKTGMRDSKSGVKEAPTRLRCARIPCLRNTILSMTGCVYPKKTEPAEIPHQHSRCGGINITIFFLVFVPYVNSLSCPEKQKWGDYIWCISTGIYKGKTVLMRNTKPTLNTS